MENHRPLILISNDDGYQSKGINELINYVSPLGDIIVVAPESARSGFSCAFSSTEPLLLHEIQQTESIKVFASNGTPVDCVKLGLSELCPRKPDLVLSGINHGDNAGVNSHYSGTMGAVMEGAMKGIPSVAYSLCDHRPDADFTPLRSLIRALTQKVLAEGLPQGVCLNVNFPVAPIFSGVKIARMARGYWTKEVVSCHHPRGYDYYWLVGKYADLEKESEDTDRWALAHNYVAITPTEVDVTSYEALELLKAWEL